MSLCRPATLYRVAPFILFIAFVGIEEGLRFLVDNSALTVPPVYIYYLYPVKIVSVTALLIMFFPFYQELRFPDLKSLSTVISILCGFLVFGLWVNINSPLLTFGTPQGYDASFIPAHPVFGFVRLCGAGFIVPVMEELFWRSFLIRYMVNEDFERVPVGRFTWTSFILSTVLFGLEHNLVVAGILAGAAYNVLLYYTKSLAQCILAHAVTNFALGIYVLLTGKWHFW